MASDDGLQAYVGRLARLSHARSRSISPENLTGAKGQACLATAGTGAQAARELGLGWKISPSIIIGAGETRVLADIEGPGAITHIWMTPTGGANLRRSVPCRFASTPAADSTVTGKCLFKSAAG